MLDAYWRNNLGLSWVSGRCLKRARTLIAQGLTQCPRSRHPAQSSEDRALQSARDPGEYPDILRHDTLTNSHVPDLIRHATKIDKSCLVASLRVSSGLRHADIRPPGNPMAPGANATATVARFSSSRHRRRRSIPVMICIWPIAPSPAPLKNPPLAPTEHKDTASGARTVGCLRRIDILNTPTMADAILTMLQ
jgi:hypothetical protein